MTRTGADAPVRDVLIAGASIAGPALGCWLRRYGWRTTIVETAPALRTGGQNIDVRGAGREVARRLGIEDAIRAATTGEQGTRFVGPDGAVIAEFPAGTDDASGTTAELEILRGDLARLLVDQTVAPTSRHEARHDQPDDTETGPPTEYRWGDRIAELTDRGDAVDVVFEHGGRGRYDLVVAADGIGSTTRRLVFGNEAEIKPLGLETTWLTIPRVETDRDWWYWYSATGGRSVTLRPDRVGTIRATLGLPPDRAGADARSRTTDEQKARLTERFAGVGWQAERVIADLAGSEELYFEEIGQVHARRWSVGRVALLGDAAYCASPVSGMGTSLALVGAYVLAGELAGSPDHTVAFRRYEQIMRPYVDQAQRLPPGTPRVANPRTRWGLGAFRLALRAAATRPVGAVAGRLFRPPADRIELPDYSSAPDPIPT